jgi:hypothetical protein
LPKHTRRSFHEKSIEPFAGIFFYFQVAADSTCLPQTWVPKHGWKPTHGYRLNLHPYNSYWLNPVHLLLFSVLVSYSPLQAFCFYKIGKKAALPFYGVSDFYCGVCPPFLRGSVTKPFPMSLNLQEGKSAFGQAGGEIWYLMVFTVSMNFIVSAVAYSSTTAKLPKGLLIYAIANSIIYLAVVLSGALMPNQFLASFECMLLFTGPSFIILSIVNLAAWIKAKSLLDARLFLAWIGFFIVTALYFVYYISGLADVLWKQGIWFNANDVLHIGLIIWVAYLLVGVKKLCADFPTDTTLQR